ILLIQDKTGIFHVFDSKENLKDIAKYIWNEPNLENYRITGKENPNKIKDLIFVELAKDKTQRLRSSSEFLDDHYFED
ncbi:MAG: hypothetical protein HYU63_00050, partial [Armatimonadetes bacterium]|nr:hypothetical protein [Armatimonadota bacterium]